MSWRMWGGPFDDAMKQPEDFDVSRLEESISQLPSIASTLKDARRKITKSKSSEDVAKQQQSSGFLKPVGSGGLLPQRTGLAAEESVYHPPYEYGADFTAASTVKANLVPLVLGGEAASSSEAQDSKIKATALRIESQKTAMLRDLYPFYKELKANAPKSESEKALPNLDWTGSHLRFKHLLCSELRFGTGALDGAESASGESSATGAPHLVGKDSAKPKEEESSVPLTKQWECLRLYMQPLITLGFIHEDPELPATAAAQSKTTAVMENSWLSVLFREMSEAFPALVYFIVRMDESVDVLKLLSGKGGEAKATIFTKYHQALGHLSSSGLSSSTHPAEASSAWDHETRCSLDSVMQRVGASLILAMEHWITNASPASLALTTPLDLLRTGDLGASSISISEHERVSHMKYSHIGRLKKELGDYCLCVQSPDDALVHYSAALDVTKECEDLLWHACSLEGTCAVDVCAFFRDNSDVTEPVAQKKLEQLWLSIRQACEQAAGLYKSLPTLRASLLLKAAHFGSQLKAFNTKSWTFKFMTQMQIERYIDEVVDALPSLQLISSEESAAFCLLDISKIYSLCSKKKKSAQFMLLAASSFPDTHKDLILHLTVCAGHVYGLDNDFARFCDWQLLKRHDILDLYSSSLQTLKGPTSHVLRWPKLIHTVQFGIVSNALSGGKRLLAARAAFYFLHLWVSRLSKDKMENRTFQWLFRVIGNPGGQDQLHQEDRYSLSLLCSADVLEVPGKVTRKEKEKRAKNRVFLYCPEETKEEPEGAAAFLVKSGSAVKFRTILRNPFPVGLKILCKLVVRLTKGEVMTTTFTEVVTVRADKDSEAVLRFTPVAECDQSEVRVVGCSFRLGNFTWTQNFPYSFAFVVV